MKKRILFYSESWGIGGIETLIMDIIRNIDHSKYTIDIFSTWDSNSLFDSELQKYDIHRYTVFHGYRPNLLVRQVLSIIKFRKLLNKNHYDIVHINTMNGMGFTFSAAALLEHVNIRIVHSHNANFGEGHYFAKSFAHKFGKTFLGNTANVRLATSSAAGKYLFDSKRFIILHNGIDTEKYRYNSEGRSVLRRKYQIADHTLVTGTIGRLVEQKNPLFVLEAFRELHQIIPDSALLLIGAGDLEAEIDSYISNNSLDSSVIRIGRVSSSAQYYSAFDLFFAASHYEGFGITVLEAQCNGLPVFCSTAFPQEVLITPLVNRMELTYGPKFWAERAISYHTNFVEHGGERKNYADVIKREGYSIIDMIKNLEHIYERGI